MTRYILALYVRVLKSLEFAGNDENAQSAVDDKAKTLETLLLEKNRSLQTENTQLKVANNDLTGEKNSPICFVVDSSHILCRS